MKNSKQLKQERADLVDELNGIIKGAETENRSFTDEENTRQDAIHAEIEALDTSIARAEKNEAIARQATPAPGPSGEEKEIHELRKEIRLTKVFRELQAGGLTGVEKEITQEARREAAGQVSLSGFAIPASFMRSESRNFSTTAAEGGNAIATDTTDIVEALRPRPKVQELGATVFDNLTNTLELPLEENYVSPGMVAESGAASAGPTDPLGKLTLSPKRISAYTDVSMMLLAQTNPSIDAFIARVLRREAEIKMDSQAINGSGSGNEMTGILQTSGIGDVAGGTNGGAPDWQDLIDLKTDVANAEALFGKLAYLTTPDVVGKLETTAKDSGSGLFLVDGMKTNGYDVHQSTIVPSNLTKGTSSGVCHAILFGNWEEAILAYWGGIMLTIDEVTQATSGEVRLVLNRFADFGVRHAGAFSAMKDALVS